METFSFNFMKNNEMEEKIVAQDEQAHMYDEQARMTEGMS